MIRKNNMYKKAPCGDFVILTQEGKPISLISPEDIEKAMKHYWNITRQGYVYSWGSRIQLHNYLLDIDEHDFQKEVDHINQNRLDNTRDNLRIVTRQQNNFNRGINKNNTSGYKGVAWHKQRQKWRAYIMVDHKQISLGLHDTPEEAHYARLKAEENIIDQVFANNRYVTIEEIEDEM